MAGRKCGPAVAIPDSISRYISSRETFAKAAVLKLHCLLHAARQCGGRPANGCVMVARRYNGKGRTTDEQHGGGEDAKPQAGRQRPTPDRPSLVRGQDRTDNAKPGADQGEKPSATEIIDRIEDADRQDGKELDAMLKKAMEPLLDDTVPPKLTEMVEEARKKLKK